MKYELKMMGGNKFTITEEDKKAIVGKNGLVFVPSLGGLINISSISSILPDNIIEKTEVILSDGLRAVKKFGVWVNELNGNKIDVKHYPELTQKKDDIKLIK